MATAYQCLRSVTLDALNAYAAEFQHVRLQSRHLHISTDHPQNVFGLVVPTGACRDDGVAHATEHLVGCGSRRFPAPRPFHAMMSRSLGSYLNNLTFADVTVYAFATPDTDDFFNLLDVYLDGIFFPLLRDEAFAREVHRLAPDGRPLSGPIVNEMQMMARAPGVALERSVGRALFPDLAYAHNHGGIPERLMHLSVDEVRTFHRDHYHPSRCAFFTSGALPLPRVLDVINRRAMEVFEPDTPAGLPLQVPFPKPRRRWDLDPAAAAGEDVITFGMAWATCSAAEVEEVWRIRLAAEILFGANGSVGETLCRSEFAGEFHPAASFQGQYVQPVLCVAWRGISRASLNDIEEVVLSTAAQPLLPKAWEAALARLESPIGRETDRLPPGIRWVQRLSRLCLLGGDPLKALDAATAVAQLQQEGVAGAQATIARYVTRNMHRATLALQAVSRSATSSCRIVVPNTQAWGKARLLPQSQFEDGGLPIVPLGSLAFECVPRHGRWVDLGSLKAECFDTDGDTMQVELRLPLSPAAQTAFDAIPLLAGLIPGLAPRSSRDVFTRARARFKAEPRGRRVAPGTGAGWLVIRSEFAATEAAPLGKAWAAALRAGLPSPAALRQIVCRMRAHAQHSVLSDPLPALKAAAAALVGTAAGIEDRVNGLSASDQFALLDEFLILMPELTCQALEKSRNALLAAPMAMSVAGPPEPSDRFLEVFALSAQPRRPEGDLSSPEGGPVAAPQHRVFSLIQCPPFEALAFKAPAIWESDGANFALLAAFLRAFVLSPLVREALGAYASDVDYDPEGSILTFAWSPVGGLQASGVFDTALAIVEQSTDAKIPIPARLSALRALRPLLSSATAWDELEGYGRVIKEDFLDRLHNATADELRRTASRCRATAPHTATILGTSD